MLALSSKCSPMLEVTGFCQSVAGALFGWDNGITGGVVSMQGFLEKFFPDVLAKPSTTAGNSLYCTFDDQRIQWFTSSLFLAGAATELSGTTGSSILGNVLQIAAL